MCLFPMIKMHVLLVKKTQLIKRQIIKTLNQKESFCISTLCLACQITTLSDDQKMTTMLVDHIAFFNVFRRGPGRLIE
jgi:hypothetical protein